MKLFLKVSVKSILSNLTFVPPPKPLIPKYACNYDRGNDYPGLKWDVSVKDVNNCANQEVNQGLAGGKLGLGWGRDLLASLIDQNKIQLLPTLGTNRPGRIGLGKF